jgi:hypothetical protein
LCPLIDKLNKMNPLIRKELEPFKNEVNKTLLVDKKIDDEPLKVINCKNCKIVNCDFSFDGDDKNMLTLDNCVGCVVTGCEFHDKKKKGLFINIRGEKSKGNIIEGCIFRDHNYPGEMVNGKLKKNGGEPIRIGGSEFSGCEFKTIVRNCHFRNLTGDPETVSIKSCGNTLENNLHEDCESNFTIRHGGFNFIRNNSFKGSGGIRVIGDGNEITGNYHQNNSSGKYPPLTVSNGTIEVDPNFDDEGKPHDSEGCSHHAYARSKNNKIESNIYENCEETCVLWGKERTVSDDDRGEKECKGKKYKLTEGFLPTKNKFRNNILIGDNKESLLLRLDKGAKLADNVFEANKLFGEKAKRGDMLQEAIENLSSRPEIKIPHAGPKVSQVTQAASS